MDPVLSDSDTIAVSTHSTAGPQPEQMLASSPRLAASGALDATKSTWTTDLAPTDAQSREKSIETSGSTPSSAPQYSARTQEIVERVAADIASAAKAGTPSWEAAKERIMKDMAISDKFSPSTPTDGTGSRRSGGRGGRRSTENSKGRNERDDHTPPSSRGRGKGPGRPRGRGRGGASGRGGGKRKREDRDEGESDSSEVCTPVATTTKSGRSIQKPTSFVPPPPSPTTTTSKRKRTFRRNPQSAVCKICLRGTSPASNMIVFCDGCNTPYHRYCHHPPIDQAVVDEVEKEWYCRQCERERIMPVPESEIASFVSAEGASPEQRRAYFSTLTPGMLVTLLTKATTLQTDLPVFSQDFVKATQPIPFAANPIKPNEPTTKTVPNKPPFVYTNVSGVVRESPTNQFAPAIALDYAAPAPPGSLDDNDDEPEGYGADVHPPSYPRPGQGLMKTLPPEQEDLQWLVDDDDRYGVFTHLYQSDPAMTNPGMSTAHNNIN